MPYHLDTMDQKLEVMSWWLDMFCARFSMTNVNVTQQIFCRNAHAEANSFLTVEKKISF